MVWLHFHICTVSYDCRGWNRCYADVLDTQYRCIARQLMILRLTLSTWAHMGFRAHCAVMLKVAHVNARKDLQNIFVTAFWDRYMLVRVRV